MRQLSKISPYVGGLEGGVTPSNRGLGGDPPSIRFAKNNQPRIYNCCHYEVLRSTNPILNNFKLMTEERKGRRHHGNRYRNTQRLPLEYSTGSYHSTPNRPRKSAADPILLSVSVVHWILLKTTYLEATISFDRGRSKSSFPQSTFRLLYISLRSLAQLLL
jgi:hypothetical protein